VGRDPSANLVLTDAGVSWHHARVEDRGDVLQGGVTPAVDCPERIELPARARHEVRCRDCRPVERTLPSGGRSGPIFTSQGIGRVEAADLDALTVPDEQAWIEVRKSFLLY